MNKDLSRRQLLKRIGLGAAVLAAQPLSQVMAAGQPGASREPGSPVRAGFVLPPLPYAFDALEPHIDARTMEIHHDKHHAGYVKALNAVLEGHEKLRQQPIEWLLRNLDAVPAAIRDTVRNVGGGHYNHMLFWICMKPKGGGQPTGKLAAAIDKSFGSFRAFQDQFTSAGLKQFGSGWAWLVKDAKGKLSITSTGNQNSPVSQGFVPLLTVDVWEHAYYLHYQNRRADFLKAWWQVVNWDAVALGFDRRLA